MAGRDLSCTHRTAQLRGRNTWGHPRTWGAVSAPKLQFSPLISHLLHNVCASDCSRLERRETGDADAEAAPGTFSSPFAGLRFSILAPRVCRHLHHAHGKGSIRAAPAVPEPRDRDVKLWGHSKLVCDTLTLLLRPRIRKGASGGQMDDVYIKKETHPNHC